MPLRLEIKKELSSRSDRVKSVDIHSGDQPWVLSALYNGNVYIWDYSTNVRWRCWLFFYSRRISILPKLCDIYFNVLQKKRSFAILILKISIKVMIPLLNHLSLILLVSSILSSFVTFSLYRSCVIFTLLLCFALAFFSITNPTFLSVYPFADFVEEFRVVRSPCALC